MVETLDTEYFIPNNQVLRDLKTQGLQISARQYRKDKNLLRTAFPDLFKSPPGANFVSLQEKELICDYRGLREFKYSVENSLCLLGKNRGLKPKNTAIDWVRQRNNTERIRHRQKACTK